MATPDRPAPPIATDLRAENAELRRRVELAETELGELRREALDRRAEVRQLAEAFPAAMSRRAVTLAMLRDIANHPDKSGAIRRALAKLQRAPRKVLRMLQDR